MIRSLRKLISSFSRSILKKTILVYVLLFVIPLLVLYGWLYHTLSSQVSKDTGAQLMASLQSLSDTMDEVFRSVDFLQSQLQATQALSETVFELTPSNEKLSYAQYMLRSQVGTQLYQSFIYNKYLDSLSMYNPYSKTLFDNKTGLTRQRTENPSADKIDNMLLTSDEDILPWRVEYITEEGIYHFVRYGTLYRSLYPSQKVFTRSTVAMPILVDRLHSYTAVPQVELMLVLANKETIPASSSAMSAAQLSFSSENIMPGFGTYQHQGEQYIRATYSSPYMNWYYVATAPLSSFSSSTKVITDYLSYYLVVLFVILLLFISILLFHIVLPLRSLSRTMRKAEKGDLSVRVDNKRYDELGYIGHRLNVLLESIEKLIYENYESQLRKNMFELKYIQSQLDEHFVYNTLDSIHWIANQHGVPRISNIIFSLTRFFRLMLNQGRPTVSIRQALEISKCYIDLMNVRMDGMIVYQVEAEEELLDCQVLKYLFQPILENAIIHGIRPNGKGTITLGFTRCDDSHIRYTVCDDGVGILPEVLEDIRHSIQENIQDTRYFALLTIHNQLRLYFGHDFSFDITSRPKQGTCVTLSFPIQTVQEPLPSIRKKEA